MGRATKASHTIFATLIAAAGLTAQSATGVDKSQSPVLSWYPLQVGNSWTWQNETLDGDIANPTFERWALQKTIVSLAPDAELGGILVTEHSQVLDDVTSSDFIPANNAARKVPAESHLLIYGDCIYILDGSDVGAAKISRGSGHARATYRDELVRGTVHPDFCFSLRVGYTWGSLPNQGFDPDFIWSTVSMNADPYGPLGSATFHLTARASSGTQVNRWFTEGLGLVQENVQHHGSYQETRKRLVSATIDGITRTYDLVPARTTPLSGFDCAGNKWRHFARGDGAPFASAAACVTYTGNTK